MNARVKELWLAALRGGEYVQGKGTLCREGKEFCCLGVLTDIYVKETGQKWITFHESDADDDCYELIEWEFDDEAELLPKVVARWAGLPDMDVEVPLENGRTKCLASYNDCGATFEQIADAIERGL